MSVVRDTSEGSIWHRFEISVSSAGWVVHMGFFEAVSGSESLIGVGRVAYLLNNGVVEYHYFLI